MTADPYFNLQPDLWTQPPFVAGSATSHAAAAEIRPVARTCRERVFEYIEAHPGATDEEIASGTDLNPSTARPRRVELAKMGRIRLTTSHRMTQAGRKAQTWRVTTSDDQEF